MNAKKLTMAVASLMVLAAAFVLVVPSESDAAEEFKITDAYFQDYPTSVAVKVFFNQELTEGGSFELYFGDELVKALEIRPGQDRIQTKLGSSIEKGTYYAYIETPNGNDSTTITYPTPVAHTISVLATPAEGGQISADKETAFAGDEVTVTVTPNEEYKLTKVTINGQVLEGSTFVMPDSNVMIVAMFESAVTYCDVTFVVSSDIEPVTVKAVSEEIFKDVPAAPGIIGVQFDGWFTEDGVEFDFEKTPVTKSMTVYAHYGPEAPSTEQTTKFVAAMSDDCNLVLTAYDGNIIGKGTAKVTVYKMETIRGMNMYVAVGTFDADFESDGVYLVEDVSEDVGKIATAAGSYAVAAFVTLDNTTEQQTDYATFEIDGQA